jgi:hypothetical protein
MYNFNYFVATKFLLPQEVFVTVCCSHFRVVESVRNEGTDTSCIMLSLTFLVKHI